MQYKTQRKKARWLLKNTKLVQSEREFVEDFLTSPDTNIALDILINAMIDLAARKTRRGLPV